MQWWKGNIAELKDNMVFVFGTNPEGRHKKEYVECSMFTILKSDNFKNYVYTD